jgi:hypothetical protein
MGSFVQNASLSATPAGTKVQVPRELARLHVLHLSPQVLLQHTPSAQKPLAQSAAHPQASPSVLPPRPPSLFDVHIAASPPSSRASLAVGTSGRLSVGASTLSTGPSARAAMSAAPASLPLELELEHAPESATTSKPNNQTRPELNKRSVFI